MRRILTKPGVVKTRKFGLGNILNWEMLLAEIDKSLGCLEKKNKNTRDILCKEEKRSFIINQTSFMVL